MSIRRTGIRRFATTSNRVILNGVQAWSVFLRATIHVETAFGPSMTVGWSLWSDITSSIMLMGPGKPGNIIARFTVQNGAGARKTRDVELALGTGYALALGYGPDGPFYGVDGEFYPLGPLAPGTSSAMRPMTSGDPSGYKPQGVVASTEDLAVYSGYAATEDEFRKYRDRLIDPDAIGIGSATWRGWYKMDGPIGASVAATDPGLANSIISQSVNPFPMTTHSGDGTAVYADDTTFAPSVKIERAYLATSGRIVVVYFASIATEQEADIQSCNVPPTIAVNGKPIGEAIVKWANGEFKCACFEFPAGVEAAGPDDVVAISAPGNWVTTAAGAAEATDGFEAENFAGRCVHGDEPRTLPFGEAIEGLDKCAFLKNRVKSITFGRFVAEYGENMRPVRFTSPRTTASVYSINNDAWPNGIDETGNPGPVGLWAVQWWDTNPDDPLTMRLYAGDSVTVATERADLANVGDVLTNVTIEGKVYPKARRITRVYDFQCKPGSTVASVQVNVLIEQSKSMASFAGWVISAPGDFEYEDGKPTVLDDSDPYALSDQLKDKHGWAGSIRSWTPILSGPAPTMFLPEHIRQAGDFSWSWVPNKVSLRIDWIKSEPFDRAKTPWIYSRTFGEPYAGATDDAPFRLPIPELGEGFYTNGVMITLTSEEPHGLESFLPTDPKWWVGPWPDMEATDGRVANPSKNGSTFVVTGPKQIVIKTGPANSPGVTIVGPHDLAGCKLNVGIPGAGTLPYDMAAKMGDQLNVLARFYSLPPLATDECVRSIFRSVRDNSRPGTENWWELGCEPWNYWGQRNTWTELSAITHPGEHFYYSLVDRTGEVLELGREVFAEHGREAEVKVYLNCQYAWMDNYPGILKHASDNGIEINGVALAPYLNTGTVPPSAQAAYATSEVPECLDMWVAGIHDSTLSKGFMQRHAGWARTIADYNAAMGRECCEMVGYEGGPENFFNENVVPDAVPKERDLIYHPNMFYAYQDVILAHQVAGYKWFNRMCNFVFYHSGRNLWGDYHHFHQDHGRGDGSDGKFDNRKWEARQGRPNSKPPDQNHDRPLVSVIGEAWRTWCDEVRGLDKPAPAPIMRPPRNPARPRGR